MSYATRRVLVVDDDDLVREFLIQALGRRSELQLEQAPGKHAALELLDRSRYDLVLTDIRMEQPATGLELLRAVKQRSPTTAVILMTGYGTLNTAIDALREGADDYLLKPLTLAELDASVARVLDRRAAAVEQRNALEQAVAMLQLLASDSPTEGDNPAAQQPGTAPREQVAGELLLDAERRRVTVDGNTIELTPIELAIVQLLFSARGRLVSFEQMVSATHQLDSTREEARDLLASHIRNLRRKLGNSSSRLVNVRGIGYYLLENAD